MKLNLRNLEDAQGSTLIAKETGGAINILDRFHIMAHLSKAIDEVRAQKARELKDKGYEPILAKMRWLLLKRPENPADKQDTKLSELLQYNLRSIRGYLLKEEFQSLMKKAAKMLKRHRPLLLSWFRAEKQFSSGNRGEF